MLIDDRDRVSVLVDDRRAAPAGAVGQRSTLNGARGAVGQRSTVSEIRLQIRSVRPALTPCDSTVP